MWSFCCCETEGWNKPLVKPLSLSLANPLKHKITVHMSLLYFYFCLPLIPLGVSRDERDVCLLHVGMPGQERCCTRCLTAQNHIRSSFFLFFSFVDVSSKSVDIIHKWHGDSKNKTIVDDNVDWTKTLTKWKLHQEYRHFPLVLGSTVRPQNQRLRWAQWPRPHPKTVQQKVKQYRQTPPVCSPAKEVNWGQRRGPADLGESKSASWPWTLPNS